MLDFESLSNPYLPMIRAGAISIPKATFSISISSPARNPLLPMSYFEVVKRTACAGV